MGPSGLKFVSPSNESRGFIVLIHERKSPLVCLQYGRRTSKILQGLIFSRHSSNLETSHKSGSCHGGDLANHVAILSQIFENPFSSWLYGAVIHTAYNGSQPAWSLNDWSFAQVNLSSISENSNHPSTNNASQRFGPLNITEFKAVVGRNINVTLHTGAVRGRIERTPYETLSNSSNWVQMWDLQDTSFWNVSANPKDPGRGYQLLPVISLSSEMNTIMFASPARLKCYADGTNEKPGLSSIGYWSKNINLNEEHESAVTGYNFTVKWIVGDLFPSSLSIWKIDLI